MYEQFLWIQFKFNQTVELKARTLEDVFKEIDKVLQKYFPQDTGHFISCNPNYSNGDILRETQFLDSESLLKKYDIDEYDTSWLCKELKSDNEITNEVMDKVIEDIKQLDCFYRADVKITWHVEEPTSK